MIGPRNQLRHRFCPMLFNSASFLLLFLPATVLLFYGLGRRYGQTWALGSLLLASLLFYTLWNPPLLSVLLASCAFNYGMGHGIARSRSRLLTALAVTANLALLAYVKYTVFVLENVHALLGEPSLALNIAVPLGISFFTFQQIAYLVDLRQGKIENTGFGHYCLFVCFFPQLPSGPIVRHQAFMPQLSRTLTTLDHEHMAKGITLILIGLFKKVILVDQLIAPSTQAFFSADSQHAGFLDTWLMSALYTLQIYYDFSAYSHMAVGIALLFNLHLPINFRAPYQARDIRDYWRRWHITLTQFFRDFVYIPLGGNRGSLFTVSALIVFVFLLSGIWHGAQWGVILWGILHGVYVASHRLWSRFRPVSMTRHRLYREACWLLTLLCVIFAFMLFRADSVTALLQYTQAMFGQHTLIDSGLNDDLLQSPVLAGLHALSGLSSLALVSLLCLGLFLLCRILPYPEKWLALDQEAAPDGGSLRWRANPGWWLLMTVAALLAVMSLSRASSFIYFNF